MAGKSIKAGLGKPLPLNKETIRVEIDGAKNWSSAGVFVLGGVRRGIDGIARFHIKLVAHVDGDLGAELRNYIGRYSAFRFKFYRSTRYAYDKECEIYHKFKPSDNKKHPVRPKNTKFLCPITDCKEVKAK